MKAQDQNNTTLEPRSYLSRGQQVLVLTWICGERLISGATFETIK